MLRRLLAFCCALGIIAQEIKPGISLRADLVGDLDTTGSGDNIEPPCPDGSCQNPYLLRGTLPTCPASALQVPQHKGAATQVSQGRASSPIDEPPMPAAKATARAEEAGQNEWEGRRTTSEATLESIHREAPGEPDVLQLRAQIAAARREARRRGRGGAAGGRGDQAPPPTHVAEDQPNTAEGNTRADQEGAMGQTSQTPQAPREHQRLQTGPHPGSSSAAEGSAAAEHAHAQRSPPLAEGKKLPGGHWSAPESSQGAASVGGDSCGQGVLARRCPAGQYCCNQSCGICVAVGSGCVKLECGAAERGRTSPGQDSAVGNLLTRRKAAVVEALESNPAASVSSMFGTMQSKGGGLLDHFTVRGFSRLVDQVRLELQAETPPEASQDDPAPLEEVVQIQTLPSRDTQDTGLTVEAPVHLHSTLKRVEQAASLGALPAGTRYYYNNTRTEVDTWTVPESITGLKTGADMGQVMEGLLLRNVSGRMQEESDFLGLQRASAIRAAMRHLWKGYEDHAWGHDELKPISKRGHNAWGGMGVTLVDSLDTLWIMGMRPEFDRARDWVRDHLSFARVGAVSVFETTIRVLGGLLSAYHLSKDKVFLTKAKELADRLLPAFSSKTGIPFAKIDLATGRVLQKGHTVLAELGTLQVEFRYLSQVLGDSRYADTVNRVFDYLHSKPMKWRLYPVRVDPDSGRFEGGQVTFGALGDSFYEYLLKVWLQGGRQEERYRGMYDEAMDGVHELLVKKSGGMTYLSEMNGAKTLQHMDHLACFMAGNLALGAATTHDEARAARDLQTGKALAYTCYQMYRQTSTGLPAESVEFSGEKMTPRQNGKYYVLRPETVESLFILHQLTGDPIYREWGWEIYQAIERQCKVGAGFGSYPDVQKTKSTPNDHMESFFPAETLKYLYLLMSPEHDFDLMNYVFNTEAHALPIQQT